MKIFDRLCSITVICISPILIWGQELEIKSQDWFRERLLVDRNPQQFINIYTCNREDFRRSEHRIFFSQDNPSGVEVMILEK